jgi:hypothetical protein
MDAFEVEHEFPRIGRRIMLLNARAVFYADHAHTTLLLAFEDVTDRAREGRTVAAVGGVATAKGRAVAGAGAPCRQQPSDHRQHLAKASTSISASVSPSMICIFEAACKALVRDGASQPLSLNPTGTISRRHLAHFVSAVDRTRSFRSVAVG